MVENMVCGGKPKILLTDEVVSDLLESKNLREIGEVFLAENQEELVKEAGDAHAFIVGSARITREIIENAKYLKIIARRGVGYERIDLEAATRRGIFVTNTPGVNAQSVAEFTIGLVLSLCRRISQTNSLFKSGSIKWVERKKYIGMELDGKTIGIIGFGNIGRRVAKIAKGIGMNVLVFDPYIDNRVAEDMGVKIVCLDDLLKESDVVTIHVPLTEETRGMIGYRELSLLKKNSIIVNTSRGGIVDEDALYRCLVDGRIAGACLDVFEEEPPDFAKPLYRLENVIVTPHIAGTTSESRRRGTELVIEQVRKALSGEIPPFIVNREVFKNRGIDVA
jgi:D-3-phosphoglycerate dehydrogenase